MKSVGEDTQKIHFIVQQFGYQQSRSNLNFFFVITSILTLIKTNQHYNN